MRHEAATCMISDSCSHLLQHFLTFSGHKVAVETVEMKELCLLAVQTTGDLEGKKFFFIHLF